jgi:hypothetical protein
MKHKTKVVGLSRRFRVIQSRGAMVPADNQGAGPRIRWRGAYIGDTVNGTLGTGLSVRQLLDRMTKICYGTSVSRARRTALRRQG